MLFYAAALQTLNYDWDTLQWIRVWIAANKVGALLVAVVPHKALNVSAEWVVPTGWSKWLLLLRVSFAAAFSVV